MEQKLEELEELEKLGKPSKVTKFLCAIMACIMCFALAMPAKAFAEQTDTKPLIEGAVTALQNDIGAQSPSDMLKGQGLTPGVSLSDWIAFDLARIGVTDGASNYLAELENYVTTAYKTETQLDAYRSTEWTRLAIVVKALGGDPTSFGTASDGSKINLLSDGAYNWTHTSSLDTQGANAYIYAIEALDACSVTVPDDALYSKEYLIAQLLTYQKADGGFGFSLGSDDTSVDMTAMALCALSAHADQTGVSDAITKGLEYLSAQQGANGRFASDGEESSESSAQVVMALCALQINPESDSRFVKQNGNTLSALLSYKRDDGSFSHSDTDDTSQVEYLSTEQALRALIAYDELQSGGDGNVYTADCSINLTSSMQSAAQPSPIPWIIGGVVVGVVVVLAIVLVISRRNKKQSRTEDDW